MLISDFVQREPGFESNHYCVIEFVGKFEGEQDRTMVHLGTLQKLLQVKNSKDTYRCEMGSMDMNGYEVSNLDEQFLYTQSISLSSTETVILVKGVVSKKIIFNKRPYPNLDRIGQEERPKQSGYSMFKNKS